MIRLHMFEDRHLYKVCGSDDARAVERTASVFSSQPEETAVVKGYLRMVYPDKKGNLIPHYPEGEEGDLQYM